MTLKPGIIIFLLMFWGIMQLVIMVGDAVIYNQDTFGQVQLGTAETGAATTTMGVEETNTSPQMVLLNHVAVIFQKGPIAGAWAIATDWGDIQSALWDAFTFQAAFLTGPWVIISYFMTFIYAGISLSIIIGFFRL